MEWKYQGREASLTLNQQKELQRVNKEKSFTKAFDAKKYIKENFDIDFHLHWVQKLLKKNFNFPSKKPN